MPQSQISKIHHYIPEFYTKRWASGQGQLVEFSKPYGDIVKPRRVYPAQTGHQKHLYNLAGLPDHQAHLPEHQYFRPVDSRAADVISKMERGITEIRDEERVAWAQFILSLVFRHPENVQAMKEHLFKEAADTTPDDERKWRKMRRPGDPLTMREALADPSGRAASDRAAMRALMSSISSEKVGSHLFNMLWGSRRLPFTVPALLTSDRPLQWFGTLDHHGCHLLLPIGPKQVFYACNSLQMRSLITGADPMQLASFMNELVVRRAVKFVYAMTDRHIGYVQKNMGLKTQVTIPDLIMRMRVDKATGSKSALRRRKREER